MKRLVLMGLLLVACGHGYAGAPPQVSELKIPLCVQVDCGWKPDPAGGVTSKVLCEKDFEATRVNSPIAGNKLLVSCACCTTK